MARDPNELLGHAEDNDGIGEIDGKRITADQRHPFAGCRTRPQDDFIAGARLKATLDEQLLDQRVCDSTGDRRDDVVARAFPIPGATLVNRRTNRGPVSHQLAGRSTRSRLEHGSHDVGITTSDSNESIGDDPPLDVMLQRR